MIGLALCLNSFTPLELRNHAAQDILHYKQVASRELEKSLITKQARRGLELLVQLDEDEKGRGNA